jgi:acyl carrier protein
MKTKTEIQEDLKTIIAPYLQDKSLLEGIGGHTHLLNDLKINSAHLVDVVLDAETHFNIMIDDDSMEKMLTVDACIGVIEKKLAEHAGG